MAFLALLLASSCREAIPPVAAVAPAPVEPDGSPALQAKDGFRDLKFGMKPSDEKSFVHLFGSADGMSIWWRRNDKMRIGDSKLSSILYSFYRERLLIVRAETKGRANSVALLKSLSEAYGPGEPQDGTRTEAFRWPGKVVQLSYEYDPSTGDASASFIGAGAAAEEKERQSAAKARSARADL